MLRFSGVQILRCYFLIGSNGHVRDAEHRLRVLLGEPLSEVGHAQHAIDLEHFTSSLSAGSKHF